MSKAGRYRPSGTFCGRVGSRGGRGRVRLFFYHILDHVFLKAFEDFGRLLRAKGPQQIDQNLERVLGCQKGG